MFFLLTRPLMGDPFNYYRGTDKPLFHHVLQQLFWRNVSWVPTFFGLYFQRAWILSSFPIGSSPTGNIGFDSCFQVFKWTFYPQIRMRSLIIDWRAKGLDGLPERTTASTFKVAQNKSSWSRAAKELVMHQFQERIANEKEILRRSKGWRTS